MQTVKNKLKNKRNEHLKSIYKDTNFIVSLKQPKNSYRELAYFRFISNFKNREPINAVVKDAKLWKNYLDETNKFTKSNGQISKIRRKIDCHSVNVIYYLKCKICSN